MAFVPVSATAFTGASIRPSITPTNLIANQTLPKTPLSKRINPCMSFSSIDDPSTATTLADDGISLELQVIRNAYIQVFGNAYLMESERAELAVPESDFKLGRISVRELIRRMGKTEAYKKRFFARSGPYRFVELNFKHFLGRGPNSQDEISFHVQKLINEGYDAEIDSYINSDEYVERFGEDTVPRFVFKGTYVRNDDFNRMTAMRKHWDGCSTSTVSGSTAPGRPIPAQLILGRGDHVGYLSVMKGLPAGFRPQPRSVKPVPVIPVPKNAQAPIRVRIKVADNSYQVFETKPQVMPSTPQWKKDLQGAKRWNGVWY